MESQAGGRAHVVRVIEIIEETKDCRSIVIEAVDATEKAALSYRPGQFLTIRVPEAGSGVARCYSLSSSPHHDAELTFTVKRVVGGRASNWLCDSLSDGDLLQVLPPAGTFCPESLDEDLVLVAGGSGITPVMSIAKSVLFAGVGNVVLIYANRDEDSVIFAAELRTLQHHFPSRLVVIHVLESVQGLLSAPVLETLLKPMLDRSVFICGPTPLMDLAHEAATAAGIPAHRVHSERFVSLHGDPFVTDTPARGSGTGEVAAVIDVTLDGEQRQVPWKARQTMLDALLAAGLDAPYSCRQGACSACVCSLTSGQVRMVHNQVLSEDDVAEGNVLACQAEPVSNEVSIEY